MADDVAVQSAQVDGATLTYLLAGPEDGPRVVYVSGSGSDLRRKPNATSSPLADRCRVLAYDHRGLGRSTAGDGSGQDGSPTMADFATDLLGLLDAVGWDTCRAVGISFGGMVLMDAASRAPERFERLVLGCTSPGGEGGSSYPLHEFIGVPAAERRPAYVRILDDRNSDPDRFAAVLSVIESMEGSDHAHSPGEAAQLLARRDHDCWDRLDALTMPVLIAAGRHDGIAPPANQEAMHSRLPDSELAWFEGGHGFFIEDRAAYPAMVDFLTR